MFNGNEDQQIDATTAEQLTKNYRLENPGQTLGHYFSKRTLHAVLDNPNCVGARIYYAATENGEKELVIVGVDQNENDLISGFLGDRTFKSPPHKGAANFLNS